MSADKNTFFYGRPLLIAAVGTGLGISLGRVLLGSPAYWLAGVLALVALGAKCIRVRRLPLMLLMMSIGLLRLQLAYPVLPQPTDSCELSGRIVRTPVRQENSWLVVLGNAEQNGYIIDGRVLLTLPDSESYLYPRYGQILQTTASLSLPRSARNDGGLDLRFYYFSQGIVCTAFSGSGFVSLEDGETDFYGTLLALRDWSNTALIDMMGRVNGALAASMLHGYTDHVPDSVLADFRDSGIAHLLAVSGLHVSLLIGALVFLLRHRGYKLQLAVVAAFLLFYCAFTAFAASTVRASIMTICLLLARALWRRSDALSSLSLAFLLIVSISPFALFTAGFQLSFTAVLGILLLYPVFSAAFKRLPRPLGNSFALSISANVATLPATAANFNRLPLLAVAANLLVVPLAMLAILPAFIALLIYPLLPSLARIVAAVSGNTLTIMRAVASVAASPGLLTLAAPSLGTGLLYFLSLAFLSPFCLADQYKKHLLFSISTALCLLLWTYPVLSRPASHITVLDMPQSYAAHIHSPQGDALIGTAEALNSNTMEAYLAANGVNSPAIALGNEDGATIDFGSVQFFVSQSAVEVLGGRYETVKNGQMRFHFAGDALNIRTFADDKRYVILTEEARKAIELEDIWTTTVSLSSYAQEVYPDSICSTARKSSSSKARSHSW